MKTGIRRVGLPGMVLGAGYGLLTGCASPGPPQPPSLKLPAQATGLQAQRVGDEVHLAWTTPERTTDRVALKGPVTAVICRDLAAGQVTTGQVTTNQPHAKAAVAMQPCGEVARLVVSPGPSEYTDHLSGLLAHGPDRLLGYSVVLRNGKGRDAGPSALVYTVAGASPAPVHDFRSRTIRQGVQLEWTPAQEGSVLEVERREPRPAPGQSKPTAAPGAQPKPAAPGKMLPGHRPEAHPAQHAAPKDARDVVLLEPGSQAGGQSSGRVDPGGMVDTRVQAGHTYTYRAQRHKTVSIGTTVVELRGEPSAPVTVVDQDTFPPAPPTGLVGVPSGGLGTSLGTAAGVDLSWEMSSDQDVVGYQVYRAEGADGPWTRLTAKPVEDLSFRDLQAAANHVYRYRVTAVDSSGNESAPSAEVRQALGPV